MILHALLALELDPHPTRPAPPVLPNGLVLLSHLPQEVPAEDEDRWELHLDRQPWKLAAHYGSFCSLTDLEQAQSSERELTSRVVIRADLFRTDPGEGGVDESGEVSERRVSLNAWDEKFTFKFKAVERGSTEAVGDREASQIGGE